MLNKLRLKFVAVNMAIVTAMLLVIFTLIYSSTEMRLQDMADSTMQMLSQEGQKPAKQDGRLPYFTLQINLFGKVTVSGSSYYDLKDEAFLQELVEIVFTADSREGYIPAYSLRYKHISLGGIEKLIFLDTSSQRAALDALVETGVLIGAVSILAFLAISWLLARWAVKPVEEAWQKQRQFVSDASHELKTPLTVIMSNAELLESGENEAPDRARFAGNILAASRQMRSLTEGLLELARADNGQVKKHFARLDYSALVEDAVLPFEPVCFEKGLQLESRIEEGITLTGSSQYLKQVVDILLDNACKYATPGIVDLTLKRSGRGACLLTVSNPGEPIDPKELEKIFERFYRVDSARNEGGSFGLGLAIAKSVVTEHGGRIWAESNASGNCFFVQLPCEGL